MSAVVKGGLLVIGLGVVAAGGYGVTLLINREPKSYTLDSDKAKTVVSQHNDTSKLGSKNKDKLVADIEENKGWFDWVYKNRLKTQNNSKLESDFSSASKGYDGTDSKALNKVCNTYYKKALTDFSDSSDNENKKRNNVMWFCTPGGDKVLDTSNP